MAVPSPDSIYGLDGSDKITDGYKGDAGDVSMQDKARIAGSIGNADGDDDADDGGLGATLLRLSQTAHNQGSNFFQTAVRPAWVRGYRAYANKHMDGSKYAAPEFRGRSKFFRPKTRSAVRKRMAQAAQALFSTGDIVSISAQNEADQFQVASATVKQELLNYRLSRLTQRNGIKWFMIALGAVQDATITGICISKQTWKFKERQVITRTQLQDTVTGEMIEATETSSVIEVDRPDVHMFAPENVIFDPNANWENPAQTAQYVELRYPMSAGDAAQFIKDNLKNERIPFFDVDKKYLLTLVESTGPTDTLGPRAAREQGKDPIMLSSGEFGRVWLVEWFMRYEGEDWCFWTINNTRLLSNPVPVREAYPEQGGDRPIVIGYGELEAHRALPMSSVESWQQMQMEMNDQVNLRLDHMKQGVTPKMQIRRGRKVDVQQAMRQGPNGVIMVEEIGDVEYLEPPDTPQSAFVENNYLNQDFDDLSGAFNPLGTEQSNAGASETFGGLSLLANGSATMGEFSLTILVETWVAPVLAQVLKLEEFYESDATVLEICGERAKLFEKFGLDVVTDQMLTAETTLNIKAGVGAANHPLEKLQKFQLAMGTLTQIFTPFIQSGKMPWPVPRAKEIMDFAFGAVSIPEGAERFFSNMDAIDQPMPPQQPPPDPKAQAMMQANQVKAQDVQVKAQKAQLDAQTKMADIQQKHQDTLIKAQQAQADRRAAIIQQHLKELAEIRRAELLAHETRANQWREHSHARGMAAMSTFHDILKAGAAAAMQPEKKEPAS